MFILFKKCKNDGLLILNSFYHRFHLPFYQQTSFLKLLIVLVLCVFDMEN